MKIEKTTLLLVLTALALVPAVFAGGKQAAARGATTPHHLMRWVRATRNEVTGKVESLTASRLILARQTKGKEQEITFELDPETQREGTVVVGTEATVKFRVENTMKIATFVTAHDSTSTAARSEGPRTAAPHCRREASIGRGRPK